MDLVTKFGRFLGGAVVFAGLVGTSFGDPIDPSVTNPITPTSGVLNDSRWEINDPPDFNGNPNADDVEDATGCNCSLDSVYKNNVGANDEGTFASSYQTTFSMTATDPQNALIDYISGNFITGELIYLVVKDGNGPNSVPNAYIFDISDWNGIADINMTGFWPGTGAISHVEIFTADECVVNCGPTEVIPEPGTLVLLGSGLSLLAIWKRKSLKR